MILAWLPAALCEHHLCAVGCNFSSRTRGPEGKGRLGGDPWPVPLSSHVTHTSLSGEQGGRRARASAWAQAQLRASSSPPARSVPREPVPHCCKVLAPSPLGRLSLFRELFCCHVGVTFPALKVALPPVHGCVCHLPQKMVPS